MKEFHVEAAFKFATQHYLLHSISPKNMRPIIITALTDLIE